MALLRRVHNHLRIAYVLSQLNTLHHFFEIFLIIRQMAGVMDKYMYICKLIIHMYVNTIYVCQWYSVVPNNRYDKHGR